MSTCTIKVMQIDPYNVRLCGQPATAKFTGTIPELLCSRHYRLAQSYGVNNRELSLLAAAQPSSAADRPDEATNPEYQRFLRAFRKTN